MAAQPRWSIQEAAILLEAVINVENGKEDRKMAIERVSSNLRTIATAKKISIDDKYRNVNGITFQFQSMEYAAFGRKNSTNKTGSKLFEEVVGIYRESYQEYCDLLQTAKELLNDPIDRRSLDKIMDNKEAYKKWLLHQGRNDLFVERILEEFDKISTYSIDKKISPVRMWEISNHKQFSQYIKRLQEYKFFRVLHKEQYSFWQKNAKSYLMFLKNGFETENNVSSKFLEAVSNEADKKLCLEYPDEYKRIYHILKTDSKHAFLTIEQIATEAECGSDVAEYILQYATWSEMLGGGYVYGTNNKCKNEKIISFNVDAAYTEDSSTDKILKKAFRRGFRPRSIMDRKRFINLFEEEYGEELTDNQAIDCITKVTFLFDERLFLPKGIVEKEVAVDMCEYLKKFFEQKDILFYDVLFEAYKDRFNSLIYSSDMLTAYMRFVLRGTPLFYSENYCSYKKDAKPDISSEVIDYLIKIDRPCSYDEIYAALPHLKQENIYSVLHYNNPEILGNSKTEYFHIEIAHVNNKECNRLVEYAKRLLEGSRYITCNEIIEKLPQIDSGLFEKCEGKFTNLGLRRILTYYLRDNFDVMTGVITRKGEQMTIKDVFEDYARTHSEFTVNDVQTLAEYTGTVPYWDAVHSNAVRVNNTEFVSDTLIDFDVEGIDEAIAFYCEKYLPLAEIGDYMRFPSCGYSWNIYLLQEYVYRFSNAFGLAFLGFSKGKASGVIVKKSQENHSLDSIIIDALSQTEITTKQDAMDYLCERGFISDRRYKKVESLLKQAVVIRKKK